jgi:hypothetical protein
MVAPLTVSRTPFEPHGVLPYNASGVVPVGRLRFAFIDNRDPVAVFELTLKVDGTQQDPVKRRRLVGLAGDSLSDPEGLTLVDVNGARYLVVASSLSARPASSPGQPAAHQGLVRIRYTPDGDLHAEVMTDFRDWLLERYPSLAQAARLVPDSRGLNIEGLAWDSAHSDLVLGIRSPTVDGQASALRVHLDVEAAWTVAALEGTPMSHIRSERVPAQGIRDIAYDVDRNAFLVLVGRSISRDEVPFQLCVWSGVGTAAEVLQVEFEPSMKPEGVTVFDVDGVRQILIVDDAGGFATFKATDVPGWN